MEAAAATAKASGEDKAGSSFPPVRQESAGSAAEGAPPSIAGFAVHSKLAVGQETGGADDPIIDKSKSAGPVSHPQVAASHSNGEIDRHLEIDGLAKSAASATTSSSSRARPAFTGNSIRRQTGRVNKGSETVLAPPGDASLLLPASVATPIQYVLGRRSETSKSDPFLAPPADTARVDHSVLNRNLLNRASTQPVVPEPHAPGASAVGVEGTLPSESRPQLLLEDKPIAGVRAAYSSSPSETRVPDSVHTESSLQSSQSSAQSPVTVAEDGLSTLHESYTQARNASDRPEQVPVKGQTEFTREVTRQAADTFSISDSIGSANRGIPADTPGPSLSHDVSSEAGNLGPADESGIRAGHSVDEAVFKTAGVNSHAQPSVVVPVDGLAIVSSPAQAQVTETPRVFPQEFLWDRVGEADDAGSSQPQASRSSAGIPGSLTAGSRVRFREFSAAPSADAGAATRKWTGIASLPATEEGSASNKLPGKPAAIQFVEVKTSVDGGQPSASSPANPRVTGPQPAQAGAPALERAPTSIPNGRPNRGNQFDLAGVSPSEGANSRAGKPALVNAARQSEQDAPRSSRGGGTGIQIGHIDQPVSVHATVPAGEAPVLVRDPGGAQVATNGDVRGPATASAGSASSETFEALDSAIRLGTPSWIHAGAQRAEAGFQDPSLGWVGVRADASGGQVHATLMPASADAAQALSGHMAGLDAYLTGVHSPVQSLTLAAPANREGAMGSEQGQNQGMNQGPDQNARQDGSPESHIQPVALSDSSAVPPEVTVPVGGLIHATRAPGLEGTHISVMA